MPRAQHLQLRRDEAIYDFAWGQTLHNLCFCYNHMTIISEIVPIASFPPHCVRLAARAVRYRSWSVHP